MKPAHKFMVGRLSTESGKCNSFNLDGIFGNDRDMIRSSSTAGAASQEVKHLAIGELR